MTCYSLNTKTTEDHQPPFGGICCYIACYLIYLITIYVVYLYYYLYYISGIGSTVYGNLFYYLSKSILLFGEMVKYHPLHHLVIYNVSILWIYSYLVISTVISCNVYYIIYLSYLYIILSILLYKLCLLPPVNSVTSSCNSMYH